jgi:EAL domain-containing protein (putative c-di-GMP-specific phosphodiesterase class I)
LPPDVFIPAADECGVLPVLDEWLFGEVCRALQSWQQAERRCLPVTVNISSQQLLDPDFLPMVERVTARYNTSPSILILELRERAITDATVKGLESIEQIGRFGLEVSVDDFGADRCSLSRLQRLPLCRLTMNRKLLTSVPGDQGAATLAVAIIDLGHTLGLAVLADGVEQDVQLDFLRRHGCDQAQGPFLSQPRTLEEVVPLLPSQKVG